MEWHVVAEIVSWVRGTHGHIVAQVAMAPRRGREMSWLHLVVLGRSVMHCSNQKNATMTVCSPVRLNNTVTGAHAQHLVATRGPPRVATMRGGYAWPPRCEVGEWDEWSEY